MFPAGDIALAAAVGQLKGLEPRPGPVALRSLADRWRPARSLAARLLWHHWRHTTGRPALDVLADIGGKAAAIVAIGSCASWGGIPSADPDPTGAVGVADLLPNHSIINIP